MSIIYVHQRKLEIAMEVKITQNPLHPKVSKSNVLDILPDFSL
jgi:hypothetical protein